MIPPVRPTYQAIVDQAVLATGAATGWLLAIDGDRLRVVATAGRVGPRAVIGALVDPCGAHGYALSSGQPAALVPQPGDGDSDGAGGAAGVPTSVLTVPCAGAEVVGLLELADKHGGQPFTLPDMAAAELLGTVAGAALGEAEEPGVPLPSPSELATGLERLARSDPARYARAARLLELLLGQGPGP